MCGLDIHSHTQFQICLYTLNPYSLIRTWTTDCLKLFLRWITYFCQCNEIGPRPCYLLGHHGRGWGSAVLYLFLLLGCVGAWGVAVQVGLFQLYQGTESIALREKLTSKHDNEDVILQDRNTLRADIQIMCKNDLLRAFSMSKHHCMHPSCFFFLHLPISTAVCLLHSNAWQRIGD